MSTQRSWGQLDEGVPYHVMDRYARGGDSLVTSFIVQQNFFDKIRTDFSHYENAKRSPDPWLNSYKCYDILLGIIRQMQRDHQDRFKDKIEKEHIEKKADRLEKLLYGDNSDDWAEIVKERYKGVVENIIAAEIEQGEDSTFKGFTFPFTRAAANLYMLSMLQRKTPGTIEIEEEGKDSIPEGAIYILGSQDAVEGPVYGIALMGMRSLLHEGYLIYDLEMFVYRAIEKGLGRSQQEFLSDLSKSPIVTPIIDNADEDFEIGGTRFSIESPFRARAMKRAEKKGPKKVGRKAKRGGSNKKPKRARKQVLVPEERRSKAE